MQTVLVTGGSGEIGTLLTQQLSSKYKIVIADINKPEFNLGVNSTYCKLDITDTEAVKKLFDKYNFTKLFHLAAILSTAGERNPILAHKINATATVNLLENASKQKNNILFFFPSSIAATDHPITIYGVTKLYCENLGIYWEKYGVDFRAIRFPGLISADTLPTGGTTDYGPEMIHAAAAGKNYECFVRADTTLPFMAMPDAVGAIIKLCSASKSKLKSNIYDINSFSCSAKEIEREVKKAFPKIKITYKVNTERQKIVDSWPKIVDDSKAKNDWGWKARYDFKTTFEKYLIPRISERYKTN